MKGPRNGVLIPRPITVAAEEARLTAEFNSDPRLALSLEERDSHLVELRSTLRQLEAAFAIDLRRAEDA